MDVITIERGCIEIQRLKTIEISVLVVNETRMFNGH